MVNEKSIRIMYNPIFDSKKQTESQETAWISEFQALGVVFGM